MVQSACIASRRVHARRSRLPVQSDCSDGCKPVRLLRSTRTIGLCMQMAEKEGKQGREEGVGSSRIRITLTCQEVKPLEKGMPKPCSSGPPLHVRFRDAVSFSVAMSAGAGTCARYI